MESASVPAGRPEAGEPDLKHGSIGFVDALIVGISSTAPAYSIAAVIGIVVVGVGLQSPGVLLLSFVPMFLIASAFYYMNRADPDCGTNFSWITRAIGPRIGWVAGFAVCTTGLIVIGSLTDVAAFYIFDILGLDSLKPAGEANDPVSERIPNTLLSAILIVAVTAICVIGTEPGKWSSRILIGTQVAALLIFSVVALVKVFGGDAGEGSVDPSLAWLNPFGGGNSIDAVVLGLLTGVFIYWGWESIVNLNEETENSDSTPGKAAVVSTVVLLLTYLLVAFAVIAYAGTEGVGEFADDVGVLGAVADGALGSFSFIVILAIITSGIASAQTTILPASRTLLSMSRQGAMPKSFGRIHPRFQTPDVATMLVGGVALAWYVVFNLLSQNFLFDSLTALAIVIAFYYSLTGFACVIYHRRELFKSAKNLLFIGVAPFVGATILAGLFFKAVWEYSKVDDSYSGQSLFGIAIPAVLGVGLIVVGIVLMLLWNLRGNAAFFARRREIVDPDVAAGHKTGVAAVPEASV